MTHYLSHTATKLMSAQREERKVRKRRHVREHLIGPGPHLRGQRSREISVSGQRQQQIHRGQCVGPRTRIRVQELGKCDGEKVIRGNKMIMQIDSVSQ